MEGRIIVVDATLNFEEFHRILWLITQEIDEINEPRSNTNNGEMWALKEVFNVMEKDRDGIVSIEDLKTLFSLQIERFGCMFRSQVNEDDDGINSH